MKKSTEDEIRTSKSLEVEVINKRKPRFKLFYVKSERGIMNNRITNQFIYSYAQNFIIRVRCPMCEFITVV